MQRGKQPRIKVDAKEELATHQSTLQTAVVQNKCRLHTSTDPYLNPIFDNMACMADGATMRAVANDRLLKVNNEQRTMSADVKAYLKTADDSEKNFIRSLDIRTASRETSDEDLDDGNNNN